MSTDIILSQLTCCRAVLLRQGADHKLEAGHGGGPGGLRGVEVEGEALSAGGETEHQTAGLKHFSVSVWW